MDFETGSKAEEKDEPPRDLTAAKTAIWNALVEIAGAHESGRDAFMRNWPDCREYRFQGALGFGGKVWRRYGSPRSSYAYVSCYPEDLTEERLQIIEAVNTRLEQIAL